MYTGNLLPVHHYKLNELYDYTNNNYGTNANYLCVASSSFNYGVSGKIDKALDFTSVLPGDDGDVAYKTNLEDYTICMWLYFPEAAGASLSNSNYIVSEVNDPTTQYGVYIYVNSSTSRLEAMHCRANSGTDQGDVVRSVSTLSEGQWYHVVFSRINGGYHKLYIDGILQDINESTAISGVTSQFNLSVGPFLGTTGDKFTGYMEDFRYYNRSLNADEIYSIYNGGNGTYSHGQLLYYVPTNHFKLNETQASLSDNGYYPASFTVNGSPTFQDNGITDSELDASVTFSLNATPADYINTGVAPLKGPKCAAVWAKVPNHSGSDAYLFGSRDNTSGEARFWLGVTAAGAIEYSALGESFTYSYSGDTTSWNHYVLVIDPDDTTVFLYINGVLHDYNTLSTSDYPFTETIYLGCLNSYGTPSNGTPASLVDFRYFDYKLNLDQIIKLYNDGKGTYSTSDNSVRFLPGHQWKYNEVVTSSIIDSGNVLPLRKDISSVVDNMQTDKGHHYPNGYLFTDDIHSITEDDIIDSPDRTVSLWFRCPSINDTILAHGIVAKSPTGTPTTEIDFVLGVDNSNYFGQLYLKFSGSGSPYTSYTRYIDMNVYDYNWHHLVLVNNDNTGSATEEIIVYLDGNVVHHEYYDSSSYYRNSNDLVVGSENGTSTNYFTGYVQDLRVYDRALMFKEIRSLYNKRGGVFKDSDIYSVNGYMLNGGKDNYSITTTVYPLTSKYSKFEPIHYWPLYSNSKYQTIYDPIHWVKMHEIYNSIGAFDPTDFGTSPWSVTSPGISVNQTGYFYKSFNFNGSSHYVQTNNSSIPGKDFTISVWISPSATSSTYTIVDLTDSSDNTYFGLSISAGSYVVSFFGNTTSVACKSSGWRNVTVSVLYNKNRYELQIYEDTVKIAGNTFASTGVTLPVSGLDRNWSIGRKYGSTASAYYYGYMEDLRMYDYCLSPEEVYAVSRNGYLLQDRGKYPISLVAEKNVKLLEAEDGTRSGISVSKADFSVLSTNNYFMHFGDISVGFWVKGLVAPDSGTSYIIHKDSGQDCGWYIGYTSADVLIAGTEYLAESVRLSHDMSNIKHEWNFIMYTRENNEERLYINGNMVDHSTCVYSTDNPPLTYFTDGRIVFGNTSSSYSATMGFTLSDVIIFDYALAESEIIKLYSFKTAWHEDTNLVGYPTRLPKYHFKLNEQYLTNLVGGVQSINPSYPPLSVATAHDSGYGGKAGTIYGCIPNCPSDYSLQFEPAIPYERDRFNGWLYINNDATSNDSDPKRVDISSCADIFNSDTFTLSLVFKGSASSGAGSLLNVWDGSLVNNRLQLAFSVFSSSITIGGLSGSYVGGSQWYHVVYMRGAEWETNPHRLYINGELVDSSSAPASIADAAVVLLGVNYDGNTYNFKQEYRGHLTDVRLYDTALSDNEILNLYAKSLEISSE